ncbi:MAG: hypothetical protein LBD01_02080 [Puniceicoccales bacterium]|jgi:hypothetical protein|nr:hypothetical protein [Puniceicoccales bacterium]
MKPFVFPKFVLAGSRLLGLLWLALTAGCSSYEEETLKMTAALRGGDFGKAVGVATKNLSNAAEVDRLLWQLELGATQRAIGAFAASAAAFDGALEMVALWDTKPDVLLSREALSALNNMSSLPYRGTSYDRILLSTYQALNYLALAQYDQARVALNLALQRQVEAVEANARRIERAQEEAARSGAKGGDKKSYDARKTLESKQFRGEMDSNYAETRQMRAYADYVNPFSVWLHGVFFMTHAADNGDVERAYKSLERVAQMVPDNPTVQADYAQITERRQAGAQAVVSFEPVTYVIFETGLAPVRQEIKINVPLFIATSKVPYVGAAFPKLVFSRSRPAELSIRAGAKNAPVLAQPIVSMDSVIATDFDNALPEIATRTLVSTLTKAALSYAINETADQAMRKNDGGAGLLVWLLSRIGTATYSYATTAADLRTWHSLPQEIHIARVPTPADRVLRLTLKPSSGEHKVHLPEGTVNVVHVRSIAPGHPPVISLFVLKPYHHENGLTMRQEKCLRHGSLLSPTRFE